MTGRRGLEIRAAIAADAADIAGVLHEAGFAMPPHDVSDRLGRMDGGPGAVLLAVEWGPPSGIVALHWYQDVTAARPVALMTLLYVAQDARRRGIGRLLVKAASQAARVAGCDALCLADDTASPALAAFCGATGFSQSGRLFARNLRKRGEAAG